MAERHERQLEAEGVDLPGDVDVLGVAGAPAGDDGDVVEPVGPAARLAHPDLDLSHVQPSPSASPVGIDRTEGPTVEPMIRRLLAAVLLTLAVAGAPAVAHAADDVTHDHAAGRCGQPLGDPGPELRPGADRSRGPWRVGTAPAVRRALRGLGDRLRPGRSGPATSAAGPTASPELRRPGTARPGPMASTRARVRPGRGHRFGLLVRACDLAAPTSNPSRPESALDPVRAGRGVGAPGVSGGRRRIDVTAVSARWSFPFCAHACDHGSYLLQTSRSS